MNNYYFQKKTLSIFAIICSIFFMASCLTEMPKPPVASGPPEAYCVDDLYANNFCEQGMTLEGVYDVTFLRMWTCSEYGCDYSTLPNYNFYRYNALLGYVVFTPDRKNPYEGTVNGELIWSPNEKEFYKLDQFLTLGHYEQLPYEGVFQLKYLDHEYGGVELLVSVYRAGDGLELQFESNDGTPIFDLRVQYRSLFNSCPSTQTLYSGEEYGQCYQQERCLYLTSDCITEDDCAWLLEREGHTSGSWAPQGEWCEHVEVPERPLYQ